MPSFRLVYNAVLFMFMPTLAKWNRGNVVLILETLRESISEAMDLYGGEQPRIGHQNKRLIRIFRFISVLRRFHTHAGLSVCVCERSLDL